MVEINKKVLTILRLRKQKADLQKQFDCLNRKLMREETGLIAELKKRDIKVAGINKYLIRIKTVQKTHTQWAKAFAAVRPDLIKKIKKDKRFSHIQTYEYLDIIAKAARE